MYTPLAVRRSSLFSLLLASLLGCGPAAAPLTPPPPLPPPAASASAPPPPLVIDPDPSAATRIAADVTYLASPELAGRGTGTEGAAKAADFVAKRFAELGLLPFGDKDPSSGKPTFVQHFSARVGAKVGPASLSLTRARHVTGVATLATADGSASAEAKGKAVFVGYGITASALHWDDYAGAEVEGKIVIVLDGAPKGIKAPEAAEGAHPHAKADPHADDALRDFGGVRYKLRTAREHKAAGVVLISRSDDLPAPPTDASSMGIPGVVVGRKAAAAFFPTLRLGDDKIFESKKPTKAVAVPGDEIALKTQIEPTFAPTVNVVGLLPADKGADDYVIVGAHYDHLGHGGTKASRAPGVHAIHPGADDNASGTALMLEVARRMRALPHAPRRNMIFIAFGAEELGALGSREWVEHPPVPLEKVNAMINADMVGRLREDRLVVDGVGTAALWPALVNAANSGLGLKLNLGAEGFGASDHMSFTAARVPVIFLFTGVHDDYHMPSDTADKINAAGEERVATLAARLALDVAERPDRLAFVDAPADPHRGMRGGFKVSLGTIPDYGFAGPGVRLSGVRPDAPASRGGMKAGDVIVKVGSHEITNIHDYMFALGEMEAGREVTIEVLREGKKVSLKVVPAPGR